MGLLLLATLLLAACSRPAPPQPPLPPVLVVHPEPGAGAEVAAFAGEVRAREESALAFRVGGQLLRRYVEVGDAVRRGELLAELDPGDLRLQVQAAQAQQAAADAELARAGAERARFARLAREQLVSRSALDAQQAAYAAAAGQAKAARASLEVARNQAAYTQLRAPRDGAIATRQAEAGQVVAAGQPVFTLAGAAGREVAIALPEVGIREFRVGQPAQVELWNAPAQRLRGTLREIAPAADPQTRTYAARVALDDAAAAAVELGQSARVYLAGGDGAQAALSVPLAAVQRGPGGTTAVWVVDPASHRLRLAPVQLGAFGEDRVPVLRGLHGSDWIVAAGGHLLREGQLVAPVDRANRPIKQNPPKPAH
ncbi:efflux RND transporter periplasmic adaptor subunit [Cognatiluteimonas weifangensis]